MKYIAKTEAPACLRDWINAQLDMEVPVNVTYDAFPCHKELLGKLTDEQFGLCGYTGAPVDKGRVSGLKNSTDNQASFGNHIEHLKSQAVCKQEVRSAGQAYGSVLGDDLNYHNLIAALEVKGSKGERFGAVTKENKSLPVSPTSSTCHVHFGYREDGGVDGRTEAGSAAISILKLDHPTLCGWRQNAIDVWLDAEILQSREDFDAVISAIRTVVDDRLPEFAFVIEAIALRYLE